MLALINFYAITPCPCPKLTLYRGFDLDLLNVLTAKNGSTPGDRINNKGV